MRMKHVLKQARGDCPDHAVRFGLLAVEDWEVQKYPDTAL